MKSYEKNLKIREHDVYVNVSRELNRTCGTVITTIGDVTINATEYLGLTASGLGIGVTVLVNGTLAGFRPGFLYQNSRIIHSIIQDMESDPLFTVEEVEAMQEFLKMIIPLEKTIYVEKLGTFSKLNSNFFRGHITSIETYNQGTRKTVVTYSSKSNIIRYDATALTPEECTELDKLFIFCDKSEDINCNFRKK